MKVGVSRVELKVRVRVSVREGVGKDMRKGKG